MVHDGPTKQDKKNRKKHRSSTSSFATMSIKRFAALFRSGAEATALSRGQKMEAW